MPSKTSKPPRSKSSRSSRVVPDCSEEGLRALASRLAQELKPGDRVLLEGPLGAGKSTFARALLQALKVKQPPEGSPTFAIAHEYQVPQGEVVHIDFYRLKSESEIDDTGIPSYFWERPSIVICEWLSLHPIFQHAVLKSGQCWNVSLEFSGTDRRIVQIEKLL